MKLEVEGVEILDTEEVLSITGLNRTKLYELVRYGEFSKPLKVGKKNFWKKSDIGEYLKQKQSK